MTDEVLTEFFFLTMCALENIRARIYQGSRNQRPMRTLRWTDRPSCALSQRNSIGPLLTDILAVCSEFAYHPDIHNR